MIAIEVTVVEPDRQEAFWRDDYRGGKELIIRELEGGWWRSASRWCVHEVQGGECMYCALVIEDDDRDYPEYDYEED